MILQLRVVTAVMDNFQILLAWLLNGAVVEVVGLSEAVLLDQVAQEAAVRQELLMAELEILAINLRAAVAAVDQSQRARLIEMAEPAAPV